MKSTTLLSSINTISTCFCIVGICPLEVQSISGVILVENATGIYEMSFFIFFLCCRNTCLPLLYLSFILRLVLINREIISFRRPATTFGPHVTFKNCRSISLPSAPSFHTNADVQPIHMEVQLSYDGI